MGKLYTEITEEQQQFIAQQHMFFVATAANEGLINLSPKGIDSFRVISPNRVAWLNLTGSGNETAAHVLENPRMTIMFCSFTEKPIILRLYGKAQFYQSDSPHWEQMKSLFPEIPGSRQVFEMGIDNVQTSCGFGVPLYNFEGQRDTLVQWAEKRSPEELVTYQQTKNAISLDGKPTGIASR